MTQCERVVEYIRNHGSITQAEASKYLAVGRLAARVSDLRKKGVNVVAETVRVKNRFGDRSDIARYRIKEDEVKDE